MVVAAAAVAGFAVYVGGAALASSAAGLLIAVGGAAVMAAAGVLAWQYPALAYRNLAWAFNANGIEIRRGVWWKKLVNVPRARVQHTDVQQGPLGRRFEVSTLVIHTAGTEHAKVELPGLDRRIALAVRDNLIGRGVGAAPADG